MFKIAYFFTHFSTNFQDMVQLVEIDIEENEFIRNGMDAYMQIYENLKAAAEGNEQTFCRKIPRKIFEWIYFYS